MSVLCGLTALMHMLLVLQPVDSDASPDIGGAT
jgi:hypothetical protein